MAKLLLIDDDLEVLEINKKYLSEQGFEVTTFSDSPTGLSFAQSNSLDCIVLDVMMPVLDGFEFCKELRKTSNVPIIFLTGKSSEDDKINGLVNGGDDYIVKPYSLRELKVRIDVAIKRYVVPAVTDDNKLTFGDLVIDKLDHKAFYKDEDLGLSNREYEVLLYMAERPDEEITFEELGTALFGTYQETDRRSVMVNVSRLRKKMEEHLELQDRIETVWSKGYRFSSR